MSEGDSRPRSRAWYNECHICAISIFFITQKEQHWTFPTVHASILTSHTLRFPTIYGCYSLLTQQRLSTVSSINMPVQYSRDSNRTPPPVSMPAPHTTSTGHIRLSRTVISDRARCIQTLTFRSQGQVARYRRSTAPSPNSESGSDTVARTGRPRVSTAATRVTGATLPAARLAGRRQRAESQQAQVYNPPWTSGVTPASRLATSGGASEDHTSSSSTKPRPPVAWGTTPQEGTGPTLHNEPTYPQEHFDRLRREGRRRR
jgi:hypothetical protein